MKSKLLPDLQAVSDDPVFSITANEIGASFVPGPEPGNAGANEANAPHGIFAATLPSNPGSGPMPQPDLNSISVAQASTLVVPISSGGITINLLFDNAATNIAPASFRAGIEQAATLLAASITDQITVNIQVDYSGIHGGAFTILGDVQAVNYSDVRADLINHAAAGDTTFNALPGGSSIQGQSILDVYGAQAKLWGLLGANDTTTQDGYVSFATDIDPTLLTGVALHELTHALGRAFDDGTTPNVFDLFRFTSPGVRLFRGFSSENPTPPAYFSVDGGITKLADYGQFSDPSDFFNTGVQGANDPFDEFYSSSTSQFLSAVDLQQLDALGFHVKSDVPSVTIESSGSTKLDQVGLYYYLDPINGAPASGPLFKYQGAPVSPLAPFSLLPIAAEQTASGYEVIWKPTFDSYSLWLTDSNGNYFTGVFFSLSGTTFDVESIETSFKQDLNGDGIIGLHHIETFGSTNVDLLGNNYWFDDPATGVQGAILRFNGAPEVKGQFSSQWGVWTVIGAEQTASGYKVIWNVAGTDQYRIASTDSIGNYTSFTIVSGETALLQSQEAILNQDLNGDGTIGSVPTVFIDLNGTGMFQEGIHYFVENSQAIGFLLSDAGTPVVPGRYGTWAPIASEQTATGFDVAWKDSATGNFRVWTTDSTGNHTSTILDNVAGTDANLEALETTFKEDLNGDGAIGVRIIVEASGLIGLDLINGQYFLDPVAGKAQSGPLLKFAGQPVTIAFADMNAIGVELLGTGYQVAFKAATADAYVVWFTDSNGNYVSTLINGVSGTSWTLESAEWSFNQDLNGDGAIGIPYIEAFGSTRLDKVGNNYFLDSGSGLQGPELKYQGAAVVVGQFGSLTPIGAEQTAGGYEVAWKAAGADQYTVWMTDSNGNYLSTSINAVSGTSLSLEAVEIVFQQDLNGDGLVGLPNIEAIGSTRLDQFGSNYVLDPVAGGAGPLLKYQGAAVVVGQFGSWTPIGAEQTATGYEVAWKIAGADQYIVWNTDTNGNSVSDTGVLSGGNTTLEALEVSFQQDLNGDGTIGVPPTVIEAFGSTRLDLAGSSYSLDPVSGGAGPSLKSHGVPVLPGQFGAFAPIGAEQTASGYEVAWKIAGSDQYIVWNTDSSGNYISDGGVLSGTSTVLQAAETSFHQDLNGDGTIGVPPTVIEAFGSTRLDLAGSTYSLDPVTGGSGPALKYHGAPVVPGQFGSLAPIGAEQTASGYVVAWKIAGSDQYVVWNTDSSGNYLSDGGRAVGG